MFHLIHKLILGPRRPGCRLKIQFDNHVIADQIVRHAGIIDVEITPIDREICLHGHGVIRDFYIRRKRNTLRDSVKVEIASNFLLRPGRFDTGYGESRHRIIRHVEEVLAFQMAFEPFVIRPGGFHRDLELRRTHNFAIRHLENAREVCESAISPLSALCLPGQNSRS